MTEDVERIHDLETDVTLLKSNSQLQNKILDKFDLTVERISDLVESMNRLIIIHEEKFNNQEKTNNRTENLIDQRRTELVKQIEEIEQKIFQKFDEFKKELMLEIELRLIKGKQTITQKMNHDEEFDLTKFCIKNWKYILIAVAFGLGVFAHKWGLFTWLFNYA